MCWEKRKNRIELGGGEKGDLYLERFVPATCGKDSALSHVKPPYALDRAVMLSYLGGCAG